ncbi:MAG TPA: hypothetical protein DCP28_34100 [Cytophagales bacterium]|nr:hypothetical protein [Cytophagales bacterium]
MKEPSISFHYVPAHEYLLIKVVGVYQATAENHVFLEFLERMNQFGVKKALVDYREGTYQSNTLTALDRPRLLESLKIPRSFRIASVHQEKTESLHFLESLLQNHQYKFRIFTQMQEAKEWLEISGPLPEE